MLSRLSERSLPAAREPLRSRYDPGVSSVPLILAHRGASASAPENTLSAYALAVAQDADGIELDVRTTADDVLVLHHDPGVKGVGNIVDFFYEELREAAPHVPTLDEMLAVSGDLVLNIEIKNEEGEPDHDPDDAVAEAVVEWIDANRLHSRVILTSFNWSTTGRVRMLDERIVTGQLLDRSMPVGDMLVEISAVGHAWVAPHFSSLDGDAAALIDTAHKHGLSVVVWTLDDVHRTAELAAAGLDAVITNDPAAAVAHLATLG